MLTTRVSWGRSPGQWFEVLRECGDDVRELLHDGQPTACDVDAAALTKLIQTAYTDMKKRVKAERR